MSIGSIRVQFEDLSVAVGPVFDFRASLGTLGGRTQVLFTVSDKTGIELLAILFTDVVVVLHAPPFRFSSQCRLRYNEDAARQINNRGVFPRVCLTQLYIEKGVH